MPYITIREQAKEGRVAKANSIGSAPFGSSAVIIDDVITDGESKIVPYRQAKEMGLRVENLVVLVDRQQGWKQKFEENSIDLSVWAGMTLHDVRKLLITDFGIMQRCAPEVEQKNPIIVALDERVGKKRSPSPIRCVSLDVFSRRTTSCSPEGLVLSQTFASMDPSWWILRVMISRTPWPISARGFVSIRPGL